MFVRFKDQEAAENKGFKSEHSFPVYQVRDVEEGDDLVTELLLANNEGDLLWLPMDQFKRSKPVQSGGGNRDRDRDRDRGRRPGPGNRGSARESQDDRGNRRSSGGANPYGGDSILGGRDFDD